jgi:hypothetical protein
MYGTTNIKFRTWGFGKDKVMCIELFGYDAERV